MLKSPGTIEVIRATTGCTRYIRATADHTHAVVLLVEDGVRNVCIIH
jgi:hypothetical protein